MLSLALHNLRIELKWNIGLKKWQNGGKPNFFALPFLNNSSGRRIKPFILEKDGKHGLFEGVGSLGVPVLAAGQGFEPQLMASKATVRPLDDPALYLKFKKVSPAGFEPATICLKGSCSATELRAPGDATGNRTQICTLKGCRPNR